MAPSKLHPSFLQAPYTLNPKPVDPNHQIQSPKTPNTKPLGFRWGDKGYFYMPYAPELWWEGAGRESGSPWCPFRSSKISHII